MSSNIQMIIAMAAYMLVVLAVGFYYGNKNKLRKIISSAAALSDHGSLP